MSYSKVQFSALQSSDRGGERFQGQCCPADPTGPRGGLGPAPASAAAGEATAKVLVLNLAVLENPSLPIAPFWFQVSFECNETLADGLELQIIYVGSAETEEFDPTLDSCWLAVQGDTCSSFMLMSAIHPSSVRAMPSVCP